MRILKTQLPVDNDWHELEGVHFPGQIKHIACQFDVSIVQVWFEEDTNEYVRTPSNIKGRIYGTGQPIEDIASWAGTTVVADGELVWHLAVKV